MRPRDNKLNYDPNSSIARLIVDLVKAKVILNEKAVRTLSQQPFDVVPET